MAGTGAKTGGGTRNVQLKKRLRVCAEGIMYTAAQRLRRRTGAVRRRSEVRWAWATGQSSRTGARMGDWLGLAWRARGRRLGRESGYERVCGHGRGARVRGHGTVDGWEVDKNAPDWNAFPGGHSGLLTVFS